MESGSCPPFDDGLRLTHKRRCSDKIAQNVNTDEAAVLGSSRSRTALTGQADPSSIGTGAAFYGATQSRQFKTKAMKVVDLQPYDIQTSYLAESKAASGQHPPLELLRDLRLIHHDVDR